MTGRRRSSRRRHHPSAPTAGRHSSGRDAAAVPAALLQSPSTRRLGEFLMPASVILAGVLLVVAFGYLIVNRSERREPTAASMPVPAPPALGSVPLAPTDQAVIPLPSPTSSSPSPSPTPSKPPTSRPPAAVNQIGIARAAVPDRVNLSAEGTRDWVHWGQRGTFALERDADGDFQILEGAPTAPRHRHDLSPQTFSWTGGNPVSETRDTTTGIRTCGEDNGFRLTVPATKASRTLRVYVGAVAARGRFEAKLSTGGGTRSATFEQRDDSMATAVFVVSYRGTRDGTLSLNWVTENSFDDDCGGVALQAATLR
jgi:hypothetical protein